MTRIIAGEHKGRRLATPPDRTTRPTTDRVRESIMSAVASARGGFDGAVVLDAFAGSGAMAFEALSRGAAFAELDDVDAKACRACAQNARALGYGEERVRIARRDALKGVPRPASGGIPYDVVFLDPPYAIGPAEALACVTGLQGEGNLIAPGAIVAYEHDAASADEAREAAERRGLAVLSQRRMGGTSVTLAQLP